MGPTMKVSVLPSDERSHPSRTWTRLQELELHAPRYTSYPASDRFVEAFDEASYRRWLERRRLAGVAPLSLYVHLPFCTSGCYHCTCDKVVTRSRPRTRDYLTQLGREIRMVAGLIGSGQPVARMYWGGGTPNYFAIDELAELVSIVRSAFHLHPGGDYAIEIDPRGADPDLAAQLAGIGFNRLVVGMPDLDPGVQRAIRRVQSHEQTAELVAAGLRSGFRSVGLALICGLPRQTAASFGQTMDQVIEMRPTRVLLDDYEHQPLRHRGQRHISADELPSLAELTRLHAQAHSRLTAAGYEFIGMGRFARDEDPIVRAARTGHLDWDCQGYTTQPESDLIGFGSAAISRVGACYSQNLRSPTEYADAIRRDMLPIARGIELDADDLIRRAVIHGLCAGGRVAIESIEVAHLVDFRSYFARELLALEPWISAGLVEIDSEWLLVTPTGRRYLRAISACFDRYQREFERRATVDPIL